MKKYRQKSVSLSHSDSTFSSHTKTKNLVVKTEPSP